MLKYFGLALTIAIWVAGYYFFKRWHNPTLRTISRHAASDKNAQLFFVTTLIIIGGLFYIWLIGWLAPHMKLGPAFTILAIMAAFSQTVTAMAPDTNGIGRRIHRIAAYTMATLYLPIGLLIATSGHLSNTARAITILLLAYMLITFVVVVLLGKARKSYLVYQSLYVVAF